MKRLTLALSAMLPMVVAMHASAAGDVTTDATPIRIAQSSGYQSDVTTGRTSMTAAQSAQYQADHKAAQEKWAKMTPQEQASVVASAKAKKISELTAIERVGQNNDMQKETAAQAGALKAQADAAKASWDKMTPAEKSAARKAAWTKKRSELTAIERVGQNNDTYVLPW